MDKKLIKKIVSLAALIGIFMFSGLVVFQLQTVFGWTNPLCSPPGCPGAVSAVNGNVTVNTASTTLPGTASLVIASAPAQVAAIDTSGGGIGIMSNIIGLPPVPSGPTAAASKAYVDAQVGGGGGSMVLYYREVPQTTL